MFLPLSRRSMYSAACSNVSMFISNIFTCFRYCRGRAMSTRASTTLIARQVNSRHTAVAVQLSAVRSCAAVIIAAPLSCRLPPAHGPTLLRVQLGWQQHSSGEITLQITPPFNILCPNCTKNISSHKIILPEYAPLLSSAVGTTS